MKWVTKLTLVKTHHHRGLCRTYYNAKGDKTRTPYCLYDGQNEIYICSKDGEPSHPVGKVTDYIIEG